MSTLSLPKKPGFPPRKPLKPVAWNHQHELNSAKGKTITLCLGEGVEGVKIVGTLIEADQFTVKLRTSNGETPVYFKSAIVGFNVRA